MRRLEDVAQFLHTRKGASMHRLNELEAHPFQTEKLQAFAEGMALMEHRFADELLSMIENVIENERASVRSKQRPRHIPQ